MSPWITIPVVGFVYVAGFCFYYDRLACPANRRKDRLTWGAMGLRLSACFLWPLLAVGELLLRVTGLGETFP